MRLIKYEFITAENKQEFDVLRAYLSSSCIYFNTDEDGTISFKMDGKNVKLSIEKLKKLEVK